MATQFITIVSKDLVDFDKRANLVSKELNAFATQTHVTEMGGSLFFTAVLFYKGD